jgi:hypothetical protein
MNEEAFKKRLETLAHLLTVTVIAVYVCGFIVLAVQHASFGLPQLNLLRPRILSAGVLLIVFAGIPALETLRISDVRKFVSANPTLPDKFAPALHMAPLLISMMAVSAFFFRQLLVGSWFSSGTHDSWVFLGLVPFAALNSCCGGLVSADVGSRRGHQLRFRVAHLLRIPHGGQDAIHIGRMVLLVRVYISSNLWPLEKCRKATSCELISSRRRCGSYIRFFRAVRLSSNSCNARRWRTHPRNTLFRAPGHAAANRDGSATSSLDSRRNRCRILFFTNQRRQEGCFCSKERDCSNLLRRLGSKQCRKINGRSTAG